jgi:V/A-type H+-transporting ATPase subunit G/H
MAQAEQRAAEHLTQVIRDTERTCDELRAQAQGRLEQAADLIVRRVVDA